MPSINDQKRQYYSALLATGGSLADLERTYFGATSGQSLGNAKRDFFIAANGSSPGKSFNDEEFLYYSARSGLTPVGSYSLADHTKAVFDLGGPIPGGLTGLEAWYDVSAINGKNVALPADGDVVTTWKDISGNGRDVTQGTAANKPLFRSANPNLLTYNQASVETDTTGLVAQTGAPTIARSTAQSQHGAASLSITSTAAGTSAARTYTAPAGTAVTAGTRYTAIIHARANTTTRSCSCDIWWYTSGGGFITASSGSFTADSNAAWTKYTVTGIAPDTAAYASVVLNIAGIAGAGEIHYMDSLSLAVGSSTTWVPPVTLSNSKPTIQFDGSNDILSTVSLIPGYPSTYYVVAYVESQPSSGNRRIVSTAVSGDNGISIRPGVGGGDDSITYHAVQSFSYLVGTSVVNTVFSAKVPSGSGFPSLWRNGTAQTMDAAANATPVAGSGVAIGGSSVHAVYAAVNISSVLIYSGAHTNTERQQIERWLGSKYGITIA